MARRTALWLGLFGALLAGVLIAGYVLRAAQQGSVEGTPYVNGFPTTGALNVMLAQGDGQAFAALAADPALRRPEQFSGQTAPTRVGVEAAYRAQRPLLGYLGWATSLGQPRLINGALVVWQVIGAGLAAGALAALLVMRGSERPHLAIVAILLPGSLLAMSWLGPELLGIGLAFGAWALVGRRFWMAVLLLTLAALVRESMLLVPASLALVLLGRRRIREAAMLAIPAFTYISWVLVVHARFEAWPSEGNAGRVGPPFEGLIDSIPSMSLVDIGFVILNAALLLVAWRHRRDPLSLLIVLSVAFATTAGWDVWLNRGAINRVMLPAQIAAGVVLLTGEHDPFKGLVRSGQTTTT